MKKITLALAVIAACGLVSCQREKNIETPEIGENGVAFSLQGAPLTKSMGNALPAETTSIPVDIEGSEEKFYLEESVEDLNAGYAPATKGTPAYTENVGVLYANQMAVHADGFTEADAVFANVDQEMVGGGWRFHHNYNGNPWPADENKAVDFYFAMPATMTSHGVKNLTYGKTDGKQTISFDYTSPIGTVHAATEEGGKETVDNDAAAVQQDIIFAARSLSKADHMAALPNGAPVLFHHALTGVKFRIVNNDEHELDENGNPKGKTKRTQTYITKVTINGLKKSGSCVVTPREETDCYVDDRYDDHSSADHTFTTTGTAGTIAWTYSDGTGEFSQSFEESNIVDYNGTDKGGSFENQGDYPKSFSGAGNKNNLNDSDASMTFWFIPQEMTDDVVMTVEFHVWDGDENQKSKTLTVNLGEIAKKNDLTKAWKAGELRTFSLKPLDVNVDIKDTMDQFIKSDVRIKNTGNVSQYVRVYMIGNWVGKRLLNADDDPDTIDDTILMGYTTEDGEDEVLRWNDKDFTGTAASPDYEDWTAPGGKTYTYEPYGTFVGLPPMGSKNAGGTMVNNWIRHDKFYYYTKPIGPSNFVPDTDPLFTSYTVDENKIPDFWITDNTGLKRLKAVGVHLVMDIAVQAIEAPMDENGNPTKTYLEAWTDALNPNNADPDFNINDL